MLRARKSGVLTPCIFFVEHEAATIFMEHIEGQSVKDVLLSGNLTPNGGSCRSLASVLIHAVDWFDAETIRKSVTADTQQMLWYFLLRL